MEVEVVTRKVGEGGHVKVRTVDSMLRQAVAGNFHCDSLDAIANESRQGCLQFTGLRCCTSRLP